MKSEDLMKKLKKIAEKNREPGTGILICTLEGDNLNIHLNAQRLIISELVMDLCDAGDDMFDAVMYGIDNSKRAKRDSSDVEDLEISYKYNA